MEAVLNWQIVVQKVSKQANQLKEKSYREDNVF